MADDNNFQSRPSSTPITWEANEFESHARGMGWYVLVSAVLVLFLAYTLYTHRWILSAVVVMVGVVLFLSGRLQPRRVAYQIDQAGFTMGEQTLTYEQLKTFWFSRPRRASATLNLISTMRVMPVISVKIPMDMVGKAKVVLGQHLPESSNQGEDWIDRLNRWLKV